MSRFLLLSLVALSLLAADDPPKPPAEPSSELKIPTGGPDLLLKFIRESRPRVRTKADFDVMIQAADQVLGHAEAKDDQKSAARMMKMSLLYTASNRLGADFHQRFDAYTAQVIKELPDADEAASAKGFQWLKKYYTPPDRIDAKGVPELLELGKKHPQNTLVAQVFSMYAGTISGDQEAIDFLKQAVEIYGQTPTGERFKGMLTNRQILGQPMEIAGPTLDGKSFEMSSLQGKVILVDFWATWCGPCVRELPHVKKVYEKYREQGFEVVAISLDNDRAALEKFVKERQVPWVQIIFQNEKERGWDNPLARRYGIDSIPATFLIGRDGRVVARDLRGEKQLEDAVTAALKK